MISDTEQQCFIPAWRNTPSNQNLKNSKNHLQDVWYYWPLSIWADSTKPLFSILGITRSTRFEVNFVPHTQQHCKWYYFRSSSCMVQTLAPCPNDNCFSIWINSVKLAQCCVHSLFPREDSFKVNLFSHCEVCVTEIVGKIYRTSRVNTSSLSSSDT